MIACTQTMWCAACKTLQDVVTESDLFSEEEARKARNGDFRCPGCGGGNLAEWNAGEPCPACGGDLVDTGEIRDFWD